MLENLAGLPAYDATISVSVIEHLPAEVRRALLRSMMATTAAGGITLLTVDVDRGETSLWNRNMGKQVDPPEEHGSLDDVVNEAREAGYALESASIIRDTGHPDVDIGWIVLRK